MNIIICDDEKSTCGELERMLMEYARKNGICFNIEVFFTGDSLADYLDKEVVDVLFLDIEIPGLDGIMVGDYIRRKLENESIFIVYISSKEQYALQLFQNRPGSNIHADERRSYDERAAKTGIQCPDRSRELFHYPRICEQ